MKERIHDILEERLHKDALLKKIKNDDVYIQEIIVLAYGDEEPQSWRSAWILNHLMKKNDKRISPHLNEYLREIKTKKDGHQRELLKILEKMELSERQEGDLFDACMDIWETLSKSPSVRVVAFRVMMGIVKKYPELWNEIEFLTEEQYTETLTPGITRTFQNIIKGFKKN